MQKTVIELRAMLEMLPDDMPVEFQPITNAWLGAAYPMRCNGMAFYSSDGGYALPNDEGAHLSIYLYEDDSEK